MLIMKKLFYFINKTVCYGTCAAIVIALLATGPNAFASLHDVMSLYKLFTTKVTISVGSEIHIKHIALNKKPEQNALHMQTIVDTHVDTQKSDAKPVDIHTDIHSPPPLLAQTESDQSSSDAEHVAIQPQKLEHDENTHLSSQGNIQRLFTFSGQVFEAFTQGKEEISEAMVQIVGLGEEGQTPTDRQGRFEFSKLSMAGVLPVVISKQGYLNSRVDLRPEKAGRVELVTKESVLRAATSIGKSVTEGSGFLFGEIEKQYDEDAELTHGFRIGLMGIVDAGVVYLDDEGVPNLELKSTARSGQFMILNMQPGTYVLTVSDSKGFARAPHLIHILQNEGLVKKISLGRPVQVNGKIVDIGRIIEKKRHGKPLSGARVELLGTGRSAVAGTDGSFWIPDVYVDCDDLGNYLQIEDERVYRTLVPYRCEKSEFSTTIKIFNAHTVKAHVHDADSVLASEQSIVLGRVNFNRPVKVQLWGPEEVSSDDFKNERGTDFYFENDGRIESRRHRTTKNKNFMILNGPDGLSYLQVFNKQAFNKHGQTLLYWPLLLLPSSVTVYTQ